MPNPESDNKKAQNYRDRKIFVGGILNTSDEDLRKYFSQFGKIVSAQVPHFHAGFGFVEFETIEDCQKALKQPRQEIKGKMCDVMKCKSELSKSKQLNDSPNQSETRPSSSMSKEEQDIRKLLAQRHAYSKPTTQDKPKSTPNSNTQNNTIVNQRAQLRSLEECLKNLHAMNARKSAEIENLHNEIRNLTDQIDVVTTEKEQLNLRIEEHEALLKEVHRVLMTDQNTNQGIAECCLCCNAKVSSTLLPCGHCCFCYECGTKKSWDSNGRLCPICRKNVDRVIKIFL